MRKWMAVFLIACLVTAIGSAVAFVDFRAQSKDVRATTVAESGDSSYADSLVLETLCSSEQVQWKSTSEWKQGEITTVTDCWSYGKKQVFLSGYYRNPTFAYVGLSIENVEYLWNTMVLPKNCGNSCQFSLREISPYYPLRANISGSFIWEEVSDFVKIRSLEEEQVVIEKTVQSYRDEYSGEIVSYEDFGYRCCFGDDYYLPEIWQVSTDAAVYFVLNNRSRAGQIMDFSDTPGGYGIYRAPIFPNPEESRVVFTSEDAEYYDSYKCGEVEQFLPLDVEKKIFSLSMDENMNRLFLFSETNGQDEVTVIDIQTGKVLAEVSTETCAISTDRTIHSLGGADFGAFFDLEANVLYVVFEGDGGQWEMQRIPITGEMKWDNSDFRYFIWWYLGDTRMAHDGNRTAIVSRAPGVHETVYDVEFRVWIFEDGEQKYKTTFRMSLDEANYYTRLQGEEKVQMQDFRIRFSE